MRKTFLGLGLLAIAAAASPAAAQDVGGGITVSGNAAITTDYRFRGLSFSDGKPAVQGGIDVAHDSGIYIGTWASSTEDSAAFGSMELDIYAGWSGEVTSGISADVGLLYYAYPGDDAGAPDADFFEPYASLSVGLGPVEATAGVAYAFDQSSLAGDNTYIYGGLSSAIPGTPITLSGQVGFNDGSLSVGGDDEYTDYKLGADWAVTPNLTASVAYVGTSGTEAIVCDDFCDDTAVFTLAASF